MRTLSILASVSVFWLIPMVTNAAVGDVRFTLPAQDPMLGAEFTVEVLVELGSQPLGSYQIDIVYDPALLQITAVLGGLTAEFSASPTFNSMDLIDGSLRITAAQAAQTVLNKVASVARVTFKAIGTAGEQGDIKPANVLLEDATLDTLTIPSQALPTTITIGGAAPTTVSLTSTSANPTNVAPIPVTATFSKDVSGFDSGDVTVTNGTVSNLTGSGKVYSFDVTPAAKGDVKVRVPANAAGNNSASNELVVEFDNVRPTVELSSTAGTTVSGKFTVTATFTESVTGFVAGDVTVEGGAVSNFSGSGTTYTFDVTPAEDATDVEVDIAAGVAKDAAGNDNEAATTLSRTVDGGATTVSLSTTAASPTNVSPIPVTATFSKDLTGFDSGDVTVTNGTVSNFSGSGKTYTFDVTPSTNGDVKVRVPANAAGNNSASNELVVEFDNVRPTVELSSTAGTTVSGKFTVAATFTESVTGFVAGDVTVEGGTVSNFSGSGTTYTFDVTPASNATDIEVDIAAGVARDAATNDNLAAMTLSRTYAGETCSLTISAGSTSAFAAGGTTAAFMVDTSSDDCAWTVATSVGTTSVPGDTGDGAFTVTIPRNTGTSSREIWVTVALSDEPDTAETVTIVQDTPSGSGDGNGLDYNTENFSRDSFDLNNRQVYFIPDGSADTYLRGVFDISDWPIDPEVLTAIDFTETDPFVLNLPEGSEVEYFGALYDTLFIGSDGVVALGAPGTGNDSLTEHLSTPQISLLGGAELARFGIFDDVIAVAFEFAGGGGCLLEFLTYYPGEMALTFVNVQQEAGGLVGLSNGPLAGASSNEITEFLRDSFRESDLSASHGITQDELGAYKGQIDSGETVFGNNIDGFGSLDTSCFSADGSGVWYLWVPGSSGDVEISLCSSGTDFDATLTVLEFTAFANYSVAACDDDSCGESLRPSVSMYVTEGVEYVVRVAGYGGIQGNFVMDVSGGDIEDNCNGLSMAECLLDGFFGADVNGDDLLDFNEAVDWAGVLSQGSFGALDTNGDGALDYDELYNRVYPEPTKNPVGCSANLKSSRDFGGTLGDMFVLLAVLLPLGVLTFTK